MARFRILPQRSRLVVTARSSLHPIRIETAGLEGWFEAGREGDGLDTEVAPNAQVQIELELLRTGNPLYDREIERRLEARKYPRVVGSVQGIRALDGDGRYAIASELRLHGVTRSLEVEVAVRFLDADTVEVEGEHTIDVRDFGLEPPRLLLLKVRPDVHVRCVAVAEREA